MAETYPLTTSDVMDRGASIARQQEFTLRASAAMTTSYVAGSHFKCQPGRAFALEFALTWADSTSVEWYVEWSSDGSTWYRSCNFAASTGTITATLNNATIANSASANWIDGPITVIDRYARVSVKKTGGSGGDAVAIRAILTT